MSELNTLNVCPRFIQPGKMHEYGEPYYEKHPQSGAQMFAGIRWKPIWVESIETIGSQVYLGIKDVWNYDETGASPDEIGDTVLYESLALYPRLQVVGAAKKRETEVKVRNDKRIVDQIVSGQTLSISKVYLNDIIEALKVHHPDINYSQDIETQEKNGPNGQQYLIIKRKKP